MIPSFISVEEAEKILATGKSINFLKQICKEDGDHMICREALQKLFAKTTGINSLILYLYICHLTVYFVVEVLFDTERSIEFHSALETVYKEASLHVLLLLRENFRLMEHLQALRRYLLLGQGDFIRHLLELLAYVFLITNYFIVISSQWEIDIWQVIIIRRDNRYTNIYVH